MVAALAGEERKKLTPEEIEQKRKEAEELGAASTDRRWLMTVDVSLLSQEKTHPLFLVFRKWLLDTSSQTSSCCGLDLRTEIMSQNVHKA